MLNYFNCSDTAKDNHILMWLFEHTDRKVISEKKLLRLDYGHVLEGIQTFSSFPFRAVRKRDEPFGGIQLIICGDFLQLPPVCKANEEIKFCFQVESCL